MNYNFNEEFYPTPKSLLNKIFDGVDWKQVDTILEPSAGKGDIIEFIQNSEEAHRYHHNFEIDCIEKDPNLQAVLKQKGFRLVHDDFFTFHTWKQYDLIVMNPPFSCGDKHLLNALKLQEDGGNVICILNAETLKNPYSVTRQALALRLEDLHADISYMQNEFVSAERKTSVEIAVVKVSIPKKERDSRIFSELRESKQMSEQTVQEQTSLAENDYIKAAVKQFELETEAGIRLIREYQAMKPYMLRSLSGGNLKKNDSILYLTMDKYHPCSPEVTENEFLKVVRLKYWTSIFNDSRFTGHMTSNLLSEYRTQIDKLADYDFSCFNIKTIQADIAIKLVKGVEECIVKLFDELSFQYSYSDELGRNIHYYNGWKTNKAWIINKKVILPWMNAWGRYNGSYDPASYEIIEKLADIEKALDYLSGSSGNERGIRETLHEVKKIGQTKKIPLKYFTVTFYKKGTCHIEFTNLELLKKLNIFGSQQKGWLPPAYGKKAYSDMDEEEKKVIDEFEGVESYMETMTYSDYYLYDTSASIKCLEMVS